MGMMHVTFICDTCGAAAFKDDPSLPEGWHWIGRNDVFDITGMICPECTNRIREELDNLKVELKYKRYNNG